MKSPSERFAGADETFTIEALMQNGWALQSGTSHFLGQNFARAFDVYFQTDKGGRELVWATSWGKSPFPVDDDVMMYFMIHLCHHPPHSYYLMSIRWLLLRGEHTSSWGIGHDTFR